MDSRVLRRRTAGLAGASFALGLGLVGLSFSNLLQAQPIGWLPGYAFVAAQEVLLFGLPAWLLRKNGLPQGDTASIKPPPPPLHVVALTLLASVTFPLASVLISSLWYALLSSVGLSIPLDIVTIIPKAGVELLVALIAAAAVPAVCEEQMFRGYLLERLQRRWRARTALFVTSLLFSLLHFSLLGSFSLFVMALFLGRLRLRHGGLLLPILAHAVHNAFALVLNALGAKPSEQAILFSAGVFIAATYLLLRRRKEQSWS